MKVTVYLCDQCGKEVAQPYVELLVQNGMSRDPAGGVGTVTNARALLCQPCSASALAVLLNHSGRSYEQNQEWIKTWTSAYRKRADNLGGSSGTHFAR